MKYTQLFGKTLRNVHHGVKSQGFAFLLRGGFVRTHGHGLYSYLPLGNRVVRNLKQVIREEMERLDGQEVNVPLVNPIEMWQKSGRDRLVGSDMVRFKDRTDRNMVLAPSHEEAFVDLVRVGLRSYRDLPAFLYQFQTKYRDEERIRNGLIRTKEFLMKDAYSFHRSASDLNNFFPKVFGAYQRIFERCGLNALPAESGVGYMGGQKAYEFMIPCSIGEDIMVECPNCGYRANKNVAMGLKDFHTDTLQELEEVATPNCTSMEDLAEFMGLAKHQLAKTMIFKTMNGLVMAVVRGDHEVSREKLTRYLGEPVLEKADQREVEALGFVPGYLSPIGVNGAIPLVVDSTVAKSTNLVVGANKEGVHLKNANFGRDFESTKVADISMIKPENKCLQCGSPLQEVRALELGNIFKLDDFYSRSMGLYFQEERGHKVYPFMGSYGIGIGRLMGAIAEQLHDKRGLLWPSRIAPFRFFLMGIGKSDSVRQKVDRIYARFSADTLLDDRKESPGVKFQDAELLGIPYRIVLSAKRTSEDTVEFYNRYSRQSRLVRIDDVEPTMKEILENDELPTQGA
ncbi:MAG: proline--tRNA ligase [Spirochaetota bacterium]